MAYRWVSFLTDYGTSDGFVAACLGVLAGIAPQARVIDITHEVAPQDVRRGASVLAQVVPYLPPAVHLAVVDPGVGTSRRGVVVVAPGGVLVGPDNGLLGWAADALGGAEAAYELADPRFRLPEVSNTFHGRDVFAPAAGHLAAGLAPDALGPPVPPGRLVRLPDPVASVQAGRVRAEVGYVDRFGNVQLAAGPDLLAAAGIAPGSPVEVTAGARRVEARYGTTFGSVPVGGIVLYTDSSAVAALAVNHGSAADRLGVGVGDVVVLTAGSEGGR